MKAFTAIRYAHVIHDRLVNVNGLLATPLCRHEAFRVRRVWVFGSAIQGKQDPNDLDILIEGCAAGRYRTAKQSKVDRRQLRSFGVRLAPDSKMYFYKWLTKGMKKVSRHSFDIDGSVAHPRILIYPRFDLDPVRLPGTYCPAPRRDLEVA